MREHMRPYLVGLGTLSAACLGLLLAEATYNHAMLHSYLAWDLVLAWVPLVLASNIDRSLNRGQSWSGWQMLGLSVIWLVFLPNSFYLVSDFVHLSELTPDQLLIGTVVLSAFAFAGVSLGIASLYLIHRQLRRRLATHETVVIVGLILFVSSIAIYVGRDLRWNSWDLLFNPFGLLFDLSERLLHRSQYPQVLWVVCPFFFLLSAMYFLVWECVRSLRPNRGGAESHP